MATLFTSIFVLLFVTRWVTTQQLYPQNTKIGVISKYGYNMYPLATVGQDYDIIRNYGPNIPIIHNQQLAHDRTGYNFGNNYNGFVKDIPLYTEKKVTTFRKEQLPKTYNSNPPIKSNQSKGGFKSSISQGYGNPIKSFEKGQSKHANWNKENNIKFTPYDFAKTVNNFNKQIQQINLASYDQKINKDVRSPRLNDEGSKSLLDYIPVNIDSKFNNFNFNSDLKINNNGLNIAQGLSKGYKPNSNLKINWNHNTAPLNSGPVKYETFIPGGNGFDSPTGKINNLKSQNFVSFQKGGDPSSYVKVTNGKVTYMYKIRHLPNKH